MNKDRFASSVLPCQEPGVKPACALNYQLYADGKLSADKKNLELAFSAKNEIFGKDAPGAPFNLIFPAKYAAEGSRSYAVAAGSEVLEVLPVASFENGVYHARIYGPNGFFRELSGSAADPNIFILCEYERPEKLIKKLSGNIHLKIDNNSSKTFEIEIKDNAYKNKAINKMLPPKKEAEEGCSVVLNLNKSFGWYDFSVFIKGFDDFERRYAGHVETGNASFTDPFMGRS